MIGVQIFKFSEKNIFYNTFLATYFFAYKKKIKFSNVDVIYL